MGRTDYTPLTSSTPALSLSLMYSQIFVLTWRYHSPSSPVFAFWRSTPKLRLGAFFLHSPSTYTILFTSSFLTFSPLGRNSFRGPTPSSLANATIRLLRLSLPYSSKLSTPTSFFLSFLFLSMVLSLLFSISLLHSLTFYFPLFSPHRSWFSGFVPSPELLYHELPCRRHFTLARPCYPEIPRRIARDGTDFQWVHAKPSLINTILQTSEKRFIARLKRSLWDASLLRRKMLR